MTTVTSTGASNQNILAVFSGTFTISAFSDTGFTASAFGITATISGTGLTYDAQQQGGVLAVAITGGTITGVSQNNGAIQQTWTGFNVSGVAASNALATHDYTTFNNLFFGGADTFNYTTAPGVGVQLGGYNGDDVFNVSGGVRSGSGVTIDGGAGTDTLNLSGGVAATLNGFAQSANFDITGIETINLAAGSDYTLIVTNGFGAGGLTLNAAALGASNHLILNSYVIGGGTYGGNVTVIGGAGDDTLQPGNGANVFNGGGGTNTLDFSNISFGSHVTVNLGLTGSQSLGYGSATGTFTNFQNIVGSRGNDIITGDNGNNVILTDGGDDVINAGGGNDTIVVGNPNIFNVVNGGNNTVDGGAGTDTIVLPGARGSTTISVLNGVVTINGTGGTQTLTNVEYAQFTDVTVPLFGPLLTTTDISASRGQSFPASSLFSVSDFNGNAITAYQLYDATNDPLSGHFEINGVAQAAGTTINITAAQLSQTTFVAGRTSDNLQIRAFDGTYWSAADNANWAPFTVSVFDQPPQMQTFTRAAQHLTTYALASLFSVTDPENDTMTRYQLYDNTSDPNSGHFEINGQAMPARMTIDITAAQLAQTTFVTGTVSDDLQIRAFDGIKWSDPDNASWAPFTLIINPNIPPSVSTEMMRVAAGQTVAASSLITVVDGDGDTMTRYQLYDNTSDPNSGHFVVNGQVQAARTVIDLTAAQFAQTSFVTGTVNDDLQIRAFDGLAWSAADNAAWAPFTIGPTANNPPVVSTGGIFVARNTNLDITTNISRATDVDGDAITHFQIIDTGTDPNSGHLVVNGVAQAAGTVISVAAAPVVPGASIYGPAVTVQYVGGTIGDVLQLRAFDGISWSAPDAGPWTPFSIDVPNSAPVLSTVNLNKSHAQTLALSSLFSVSDADGDAMTAYQLLDTSTAASSGHFRINGVDQAAGTVINVTAAQLSQTSFVTGNTNDTLQIRAFDGAAWSAPDAGPWSTFTITVPPNTAPVLTTSNQTKPHLQSYSLSGLNVSFTDVDGDPAVRYQLYDNTSDPNSGHFMLNGVALPARTVIDLTAAQAAQVTFVTGFVSDDLQIRASDGLAWSAADNANWAPFTVTVPPNNAPVVTSADRRVAAGQTIALSSLISVSDADGDAMTRYQLYDNSRDPSSGHFVVNGVVQVAGQVIDLTAAQAAQTSFVTGTVSDSLQIRAFDGLAWSAADSANWAPFNIGPTVNTPPVVTTGSVAALRGQTIALSSLFSVSDADGDAMTRYQLYDNSRDPNSGHFVINGVVQAAGQVLDLTAAQLAQTTFVTGKVNDNLQIRAFDGLAWSAADSADWAPFTVTVPPNNAPVVTSADRRVAAGQTITLSNLISVSDADGDAMTRYQLYDNSRDPSSGHFVVNGVVQSAGQVIDLTAAQAAQTSFVTGTVTDNLQIRAFDGQAWSAADTANWAPFNIGPTVNHAPVVTTADTHVAAGQTIALSSLISVSDADADAMTRYQLYDNGRDPSSGHFVVNGVVQSAGQVIDLTAAQAAQTSFVTGTVSDSLQIRAFDGQAWSAADTANWAPFNIGPTVNHAPVVTTADTHVAAGQTIALSSLISVSDADADAMTRYQLYDNSRDPSSGHFVVNGVVQSAGQVIDLNAAQAAQTSFVTGTVSDNLQIRAFDGQAWSAADTADWAPFNIGPTVNHAPVVTTATVNTQPSQTLALSSLFSVSDADGDAMTRYQLWDDTTAPNSGHFAINGVTQASHTVIDISAAQLSQTSFVTGTLGDALQIRAFDGKVWSAADSAVWAPFQVNVS